MAEAVSQDTGKKVDALHQRLSAYASELRYEDLPAEVIDAAKRSVVDTLGALVAGFDGEPCAIARKLGAQVAAARGVAVIGTGMRVPPDMAAFVNATASRYAELTDIYHWPGCAVAHPSDVVTPILAAAEHAGGDGRAFITALVLGYEVCMRLAHGVRTEAFDNTNLACLGSAAGAGKALNLSPAQMSHCLSMAAVSASVLKQVRRGEKSMFKAVAAGQAGRTGVFAALMAQAGMEGPHLPFEGTAGWCAHVAGQQFSLDTLGGAGNAFKILDARTKNRAAAGPAIASILAAEKLAPIDIAGIERIVIEAHADALARCGRGSEVWDPTTREAADHSTPYLVAVALRDGTVNLDSFDDAHLHNADLRRLMRASEMVEHAAFTAAYRSLPQQHRSRVTVYLADGRQIAAEAGGDEDDLAAPKNRAQIEAKFRDLAGGRLGRQRTDDILDLLWNLEKVGNVCDIAARFAPG